MKVSCGLPAAAAVDRAEVAPSCHRKNTHTQVRHNETEKKRIIPSALCRQQDDSKTEGGSSHPGMSIRGRVGSVFACAGESIPVAGRGSSFAIASGGGVPRAASSGDGITGDAGVELGRSPSLRNRQTERR